MTRTLALVVALAVAAGCASTDPTGPLQPLASGWEQHFTIESEAAPRGDGFLVWGYLTTGSQVAWVPGTLSWPSRLYFEVPMPPAAAYRVHVFSYDRLERDRGRWPW